MDQVRFHTIVGEDRVIHLPDGIDLPRGPIEVTVRPSHPATAPESPGDPMAPTRS
jgi:hypothetical protein